MRTTDTEAETLPAPPVRLRRRADFVAAGKGKRVHLRNLTLQGNFRAESAGSPRFGFTVTKKVGGAVERNRIRRRLKEALRLAPGLAAQGDHDYVVVARREALSAPFADLQQELQRALARLHSLPPKPKPSAAEAGARMPKRDQARK